MTSYPKVRSVRPLPGKRLRVEFATGTMKVYDCTPLLEDPPFAPLKDEWFFRNVRADPNGYGAVWNDEVDLSEAELWLRGKAVSLRRA